jgi:hypothetical protein
VENQRDVAVRIGVEISSFMIGDAATLHGAVLTLIGAGAYASGGGAAVQGSGIVLEPDGGTPSAILTVDRGRLVRAAWYGLLDVAAGTTDPGKAQAVLTWTDLTNTY